MKLKPHELDAIRHDVELFPDGCTPPTEGEMLRAFRHRARLMAHIDATAPRTVTTVEELDALPDGSVVQEEASVSVAQKWGGLWRFTGDGFGTPDPHTSDRMFLPATVLYTREVPE